MYGLACDSKRAVSGPLRAAKGEELAKVSNQRPIRRETSLYFIYYYTGMLGGPLEHGPALVSSWSRGSLADSPRPPPPPRRRAGRRRGAAPVTANA